MRRIGVHISVAGGLEKGLEKAKALGCNTMQIFSASPRVWAAKDRSDDEILLFIRLRSEYDISPLVIHTSYLINLATSNPDLRKKSIGMLIREMDTADKLGADYVVIHTGSASGEEPGTARSRAISCLREVAEGGSWKSGILLENTAGERGDITSKIGELAEIMGAVSGDLISGICIDTCHSFAAGYDLRSRSGIAGLAAEIDNYVGAESLRLIHLNDSKGELGSGIDRHEHIGEGKIGIKGFRNFLGSSIFKNIPVILETPKKSDDDDPRNLNAVRNIVRAR